MHRGSNPKRRSKLNLSNENFTKIKDFLNELKISSVLTQYQEIPSFVLNDNPTPMSGTLVDWCIPSTTFINSLTDKTNPIQNPYLIDSSNINEAGFLIIESQDFRLSESQIMQIQRDNFGAIRFDGYTASLLTKNEYEHNLSALKIREENELFMEQFKRHSRNFELYEKYIETKNALNERKLTSALDDWTSPVFEPLQPIHKGCLVRLVSSLLHNFTHHISKGVEVSVENLDEQSCLLKAFDHTFKIPLSAALDLKQNGKAWLFESNGYTFISTLEQRDANIAYAEHHKQFTSFKSALTESAQLLKDEIQAEKAIAQHEVLQMLPFGYYVAIKVNVRLLHENSWGDGAKRNTVMHIVPTEELTGRLKRKANEYLCGGSSSFGTPTEKHDAILKNSGHGLHKPEITCKSCLEKAYRILGKNQSQAS